MAHFKVGEVIGVQCQVKPGPFSYERLISFDTENGPLSGFVRESELKQVSEQWYVRAVVQSVENDLINVWIRGSFFTSNGTATISRHAALAA